MKGNSINLVDFLNEIPHLESVIIESLLKDKNRIPRFDSVFKLLKVTLKSMGCDYNKLSESDKYELQAMAEDVYYGMREAGF